MTRIERIWNGGLDPRSADPLELRRRRTLVGIAAVMLPVAFMLMALNLAVTGGTDVPGILVATVMAVGSTVIQHRFGFVQLAGHCATSALYIGIVLALQDTGMHDSGWAWFAGVVVMAAMTVGTKAAVLWAIVALVTLWMASLPGLTGLDSVRNPAQALTFAIETNLYIVAVTGPMVAAAEMWTRAQRSLAASVHQLEAEVIRRTDAENRAIVAADRASDAERKALEAARLAEVAGEAKATFLATMSHELRTPMNGVLGATQLLRHTALDEGQDVLVRTIEGSGEVLLNVINDILDVSRIDAGKIVIEHIPVALGELLEQVAMPLRTRATEGDVTVVVELDDTLPDRILSDPTRLRQVLFNLGGNALKFTDRGHVRLSARRLGDRLRLEVEDSGIGIRAELLPTLFEPFVQAESSTTRRFGGSGLGLAIVRGLVAALGGTVEVTSEPGVGSRFAVDLPLEAALEVAQIEEPTSDDLARPLRILVADDNPVNRLVARGLLKQLGHSIDLAEDGQQAIDALKRGRYDVVFLDVHMPKVDGLQAARAIRALPGPQRSVPLVALTADALVQHRREALEAGMDEHLAKPVRLEDLRAVLSRVLADRSILDVSSDSAA